MLFELKTIENMVAFMILDVLVFVASEASDQYEMPFIFHSHT